jgi:eukaryotic-like serine/threonine-protein kinase
VEPGVRLGPYEIVAPLGAGGMGEVYRARDTRLEREVAIKVLPAATATDAIARARLLREARMASRLNHPNICTIHEVGEIEGHAYIVMELVEGQPLGALLSGGALPVEQALRYGQQLADALAHAHEHGVVHRDLKSANAVVTPEGRVKVLDFGLAKPLGGEVLEAATTLSQPSMTAAGALVGTLAYMAPEQLRGRPADERSDIWALGVVLYEMLVGARPFRGSTGFELSSAILREPLPPLPAAVPAPLASAIGRCLAKEPGQRFQRAREVHAAFGACLTKQPVNEKPSIAVLPFANMSGAREDDFLCEGLAEEIIGALTRIPGLIVIARTSAFAVARMGLDAREAGARLGVDNLLEGSVRRAGSRVRVTAQLVTTGDGAQVWSERYDRELTDALLLEDEIATAIAGRLRVALAGDAPERRRSGVDAEAYAAYLEGRYHFARGTPDALAKAGACFERAIARDPRLAIAYDAMAELHWYLGFFGGVQPREAFSVSTWHALRALELDDTLAETHALLGMLRKELDFNWPEVDRELRRALDLNPHSPLVRLRHAISSLLPHGRVDEAMTELEAMVQTDPLSLFTRWWLGVMATLAHRFDRAVAEGRHMIELDPTHFLGHWVLGMGLDGIGAPTEAVAELRRAHELSGGIPFTLGFLAYACGRAGDRDAALELLESAQRASATSYVPPSTFAFGYIGLGAWDTAFEWLDRSVEGRDPLIMPIKTYV